MIMLKKICNFIKDNKLLSKNDTVVCGLSGGADSVALLLSLFELKDKFGINVEAVHVNHCLRGDESDRDEEFCHQLCSRLCINFTAVSCNVMAFAEAHGLSVEEAARSMRYEVFSDVSKGKKIATAHNANDNLETMILNLSRGSGIKGLAGIPPLRGNIVRPLLAVTRAEIEDFLAERGQSFVTDSTNLSDDYTRNKIRHKIIPLLAELNSSVIETSINTTSTLREENAFIDSLADKAMEMCQDGKRLNGLSKYDSVIRKRCLSRLLTANKLPYSRQRLEEADAITVSGGKLNISRDIFLVSKNDIVSLEKIPKQVEQPVQKEMVIGKNSIFDQCELICELVDCDNLKKIEAVHKKSTFYLLDYDKIRGRIIVRSRKFGDKIQLKGRNFTSSIKKLINERIETSLRPTLHFLEDEDGTIFAECIGIAERVAPDENTSKFLRISINRS